MKEAIELQEEHFFISTTKYHQQSNKHHTGKFIDKSTIKDAFNHYVKSSYKSTSHHQNALFCKELLGNNK